MEAGAGVQARLVWTLYEKGEEKEKGRIEEKGNEKGERNKMGREACRKRCGGLWVLNAQ